MSFRTCIKCEWPKPNHTFVSSKPNICADCRRETWSVWYRKNRGHVKKYNRRRNSTIATKTQVSRRRKQKRRTDSTFREGEILSNRIQKLKRIGLTYAEYLEMLEAQNGVCAICKNPERGTRLGRTKELSVDHDHRTLAIRGLLCSACNTGLGLFRDSVEALRAAIRYLETTPGNP